MSFLKDKKDGEIAENIVEKLLKENFKTCSIEKAVGRNPLWDFCVTNNNVKTTYEVKFDKMSADTGNFAFELGNNKGPSGIRTSEADFIVYVLPNKDNQKNKYMLYFFSRAKLLEYIYSDKTIRIVNGGDNRRFKLALLPVQRIIKDISSLGTTYGVDYEQKK